jgi:hypothetical protein
VYGVFESVGSNTRGQKALPFVLLRCVPLLTQHVGLPADHQRLRIAPDEITGLLSSCSGPRAGGWAYWWVAVWLRISVLLVSGDGLYPAATNEAGSVHSSSFICRADEGYLTPRQPVTVRAGKVNTFAGSIAPGNTASPCRPSTDDYRGCLHQPR